MGYIYKITNILNGRSYIGQTVNTIEQRFIEHKSHYRTNVTNSNRPLYNAFNKYGINNFIIEEIENIPNNLLNERERYWIQYYNTYNKGYNATLGGDTTILYNYEEIVKLYKKYQNQSEVARILGCQYTTVTRALNSLNIPIVSKPKIRKSSYKVKMLDKTGRQLELFDCVTDASRYLIGHNYTTNSNLSSIAGKIKMVCDGKRKTAYKFYWSYA